MSNKSTQAPDVGEEILGTSEQEALILQSRTKARKIARSELRKWNSRLDADEVDSIVDVSLMEAVQRYDPSRGVKFMTFLYYHLRGNLIRAIAEAASGLGIIYEDEDSQRADSASQRTPDDRSKVKAVPASKVAEVMYPNESVTPDSSLYTQQLSQVMAKAIGKLDPLEREVVIRVFHNEQQLLEVAKTLGYSRCHISRVKRRALETLHKELIKTLSAEDVQVVTGTNSLKSSIDK